MCDTTYVYCVVDPFVAEAKELVKQEDGAQGLVLGNRVFDPFTFSPTIVNFTAQQYVFLRAFRLGTPLKDAATKALMTEDQAEYFLSKPKTKAWLCDRIAKDQIKNEWAEPGKWWQKGEEWLNAPKEAKPNKNEVEIWKEFGKRVQPCAEGRAGETRIEINIDAGALERSKERRRSIETQIEHEVKDEM